MSLLDELLNTPDTPLSRGAVNKSRVQSWLQEAGNKYKDAQRTENSNSTRMDAAYDSVFFCALATLSAESVQVSAKLGHHSVALEAAADVLCLSQGLVDTVEALKSWRNRKYTAAFTATSADVTDALDTALQYLEAASAWFQEKHPTLLKK